MNNIISIDVTSLKVVQSELNVSLQKSARHFEAFISNRSSLNQLTESAADLNDIVGILKMLGLSGALQLAEEMSNLLRHLISEPEKASDFSLSALSQGFIGMPCYIEYVVDCKQVIPALTLPFINEIRTALRQPIILESTQGAYTVGDIKLVDSSASADNDLPALIKRLRQLYQLGLIGLIREENTELKMQLMHRAVSRLTKAVGTSENRTQFFLAEAVLEGFLCGRLDLNFTRKRVLALLDGEFRKYEKSGRVPEALDASKELLTELVYLVHIAYSSHPASLKIINALSLTQPAMTDVIVQRERAIMQDPNAEAITADVIVQRERAIMQGPNAEAITADVIVQRERAIMQGPNAEAITAIVNAVREELEQSKEVLEIAAQNAGGNADFSNLVILFQRTANILSVIGLKLLSQILFDLKEKTERWTQGVEYDNDELLMVAYGLIYIESVLSNLNRLDLDFKETQVDDQSKMNLMSKSQFDEAQAIVIKEAQIGIANAKKNISSFVESDYDISYINSIASELISVQGGLKMLNFGEAVNVLDSGIRFVKSIIEKGLEPEQAQNVLETMADALIALEYYLSEIGLHSVAPSNVLKIAGQSLASLGFPVESKL